MSELERRSTLDDVAAATRRPRGRRRRGGGRSTGVSIDSRTLAPGAAVRGHRGAELRRPRLRGRRPRSAARRRRWCTATWPRPPGLPLVRVADTTQALERPRPPRARCRRRIPVVAITGSAGKTTTKEMTAALLGARGPGAEDRGQPQQPVRPAPDAAAPRARARCAVLELGHVRRGRAARALRDRAARRGRHHQGGARAPRVLRLRGRDRRGQGGDPGGPGARRGRRPQLATTRGCGASASSARGRRRLVRPRPRLRRLRGELARHRPRHALRPAARRRDAATWRCPCPARTSC